MANRISSPYMINYMINNKNNSDNSNYQNSNDKSKNLIFRLNKKAISNLRLMK